MFEIWDEYVQLATAGRWRLGGGLGQLEDLDPVVVGVGDVDLVVADGEVVRVEELVVAGALRAEAVAEVGQVRAEVDQAVVPGVGHPDGAVGRHGEPLGAVQSPWRWPGGRR